MLSILERYKWHQFSVVTSQIAGHDDFVQAVREHVAAMVSPKISHAGRQTSASVMTMRAIRIEEWELIAGGGTAAYSAGFPNR